MCCLMLLSYPQSCCVITTNITSCFTNFYDVVTSGFIYHGFVVQVDVDLHRVQVVGIKEIIQVTTLTFCDALNCNETLGSVNDITVRFSDIYSL